MPEDDLEMRVLRARVERARRATRPTPMEQVQDYMSTVSTGLGRGVGNLIGLPSTVAELANRGVNLGANVARRAVGRPEQPYDPEAPQLIPYAGLPTAQGATQAVLGARQKLGEAVGVDLRPYEPKTAPGRVFQETVASLPFPGSLPVNIGAGLGSALAGEATRGTPAEIPARLAGGLAGGAVPGIVGALRGKPAQVISEALRTSTPQQLNRAEQIQQAGTALGAPVTGAEAIAQAMGGNVPLTSMQRVVEQSRKGGPIMNEMMRQRPGLNREAFERAVEAVGPAPAEPGLIPGRMQGAAERVIRGAEKARTAEAGAFYKAAAPDVVPAQRVESILSDLDDIIASDQTGILAPKLGPVIDKLTAAKARPAVPGAPGARGRYVEGRYVPATPGTPGTPAQPRVPITDIENLDRARKFIRDNLDLPPFAAEALPKEVAAHVGDALDRLRTEMTAASPQFKKGKEIFAKRSAEVVEPLTQGPMGTLAQTRDFMQQARTLLPTRPTIETPDAARRTVQQLQGQDPTVARDFVRQYLKSTFDEAAQDLVGGENIFGGAKFRAEIAANPQQREILKSVVEALPGGSSTWKGFETFLDVLQAQGRRAPFNSATEFNRQITETLSGGRLSQVPQTLSLWKKWYDDFRYGRNSAEMARLLTDPESAKKMRQLALLRPSSARAKAVVSELLVPLREAEDQH